MAKARRAFLLVQIPGWLLLLYLVVAQGLPALDDGAEEVNQHIVH